MAGFGLGNYINPQVGSFIDQRRNALAGLGAGLLNGQPGAGVQAGLQADDAYAVQQKAEAERQKQIADQQALRAKYADFFTKQGKPEIAQAISDGIKDPGEAYWEFVTPKAPIKASEGDVFLDPTTYQPVGAAPAKAAPFTLGPGDIRFGADGKPIAQGNPTIKTETPPTGYRYGASGDLEFIPGGPADPSTAGKTTEATRRNQQLATVIVPELKSLLGDGQKPGTFDALADLGQQARGAVPGIGNFLTSPAYQQAQNSMRTIVASYLYSVSGATANPGEVDNQVAVLIPKPGDSPEAVADKKARLQQMVQAVVAAASGTPISVDPPGVNAPQNTSNGVQWSIEP